MHFNYCQSNLSTPPHPGSLSTRYGLSSFKRNLLRTSKAPTANKRPRAHGGKIKLHDCALHTCATAQGLEDASSCCHSSTAGTFLPLYMFSVWHFFLLIHFSIITWILLLKWQFVTINTYSEHTEVDSTTHTQMDYRLFVVSMLLGLSPLESACPRSVAWLWLRR